MLRLSYHVLKVLSYRHSGTFEKDKSDVRIKWKEF